VDVLVKILIELFDGYVLKRKIVAYVNDEGSSVNIMTIALNLVVSCDVLGLEESFQGTCFGPAFLKVC